MFEKKIADKNALLELIQGMQEIKLQNSEEKRRWKWAHIQAQKFYYRTKALVISEYQDSGASFISQIKDIFITFVAAKSVISGELTLGMMLAIQYIIGQLNAPLQQIAAFIRTAQDAKLSFERLGEIHNIENEENEAEKKIDEIETKSDIVIKDLSFKYNPLSDTVLKNINLIIPHGKVTAIVGMSGGGENHVD